MRLTEHLYQTSGVFCGTNSNTFAVDAGERLVLLDLGFRDTQWRAIQSTLRHWGLAEKPVSHAFITHGHYDHAGNTARANELGIRVIAADPDASRIEEGYPEMEELFGVPWECGLVDERPFDGQQWHFGENGLCTVTALSAPGHSGGSFAYIIEIDGHRALCTGDMFFIRPKPPEDDIELELAFMGGSDFSREDFKGTLLRMAGTHCDMLLPGHYYVWYGDTDGLCRRAAALL